jgi:hypothetical protein
MARPQGNVTAMGLALAVVLGVFAGAHIALVVGLGRRRAWLRAALSLLLPPLAPWWGWQAGLRATTMVWGAALALYAAGVAVT